jgi:hypothetical protein
VAKPGDMCVPIRSGDIIIGTRREHEYSAAEINALQEIANNLAGRL